MADNNIINPQLPKEQAPNWFGMFHSIETPHLQSAIGTALRDTGAMIEGALKNADKIVATSAEIDARDAAEKERDSYKLALQGTGEAVRKMAQSQPVEGTGLLPTVPNVGWGASVNAYPTSAKDPSVTAPSIEQSLLANKTPPVDISTLTNQVSAVYGARASGKLSETDYYARLSTIAKDVRSRYPLGYRDVIDETIKKVTGVDPANAYIKSMLADINSFIGNQQKEREHVLGMLRENMGVPGAEAAYLRLSGGGTVKEALDFLVGPMGVKYENERREAARKNYKGDTEMYSSMYEQDARDLLTGVQNEVINSIKAMPGYKNPQQLQQVAEDARTGKIKIGDEEGRMYGQLAQAWEQQYYARARELLSKKDEQGNSYVRWVDSAKLKAMTDEAAQPFKDITQAFLAKDHGLAFEAAAQLAAREADVKRVLADTPVGMSLMVYKGVKESIGDQAMVNFWGSAGLMKMGPEVQQAIKTITGQMVIDPKKADPRLEFSVPNMKTAIQKIDEIGKKIRPDDPEYMGKQGAYSFFFEKVTGVITNPAIDKETRSATAIKMFNPENFGALRNIAPDRWDDVNKRTVPGKESLYDRLTASDFSKSMHDIDGAAEKLYRDFVQTTFNQDIAHDAIARMKDLPMDDKTPWNFEYRAKLGAGSRPDLPGFVLNVGKEHEFNIHLAQKMIGGGGPQWGGREGGYSNTNIPTVSVVLNGLNKGIQGLASVAKASGMDDDQTAAYVIQSLVAGGLGYDKLQNVQGLPNKLALTLKAFADQHRFLTEAQQGSNKMEENRWLGR